MRWYVHDMDESVLRIEPTRKAAVEWLKGLSGDKVIWRYTYGPGRYEYMVGTRGEVTGQAFITREDKMRAVDIEAEPLYPYPDRPFEEGRRG